MSAQAVIPKTNGIRRAALSFGAFADAGLGPELIPIIPVGATLNPASTVKPESLGKVPGRFNRYTREWNGFWQWAAVDYKTGRADCGYWDKWKEMASIGLQTRFCPAFDIDCDDERVASAIEDAVMDRFGPAPVRDRGSARRALIYRTRTPFRKLSIAFSLPGMERRQKLEVLGRGNQIVIEGVHPSGAEYAWRDDMGLDVVGWKGLTWIQETDVRAFLVKEMAQRLQDLGATDVSGSADHSWSAGGGRLAIDHPKLRAPSANDVAEALALWPNTLDTRERWVTANAAIKGALGGDEDLYEHVEDWNTSWEGGETSPEHFQALWESLHDSAIGFAWLARQVHEHMRGCADRGEAVTDALGRSAAELAARWEDLHATARAREELWDLDTGTDDQVPEDWPDFIIEGFIDVPCIEDVEAETLENGEPAPDPKDLIDESVPEWVRNVNFDHFVANEAGKVLVMCESWDPTLQRNYLERFSFTDFQNLYCNQSIVLGYRDGKPVLAPLGKSWLQHENRRQYRKGVFLIPKGETPAEVYNLWRGFGVEPEAGDWSLYREHLHRHICRGVDADYAYLIRWMAYAVQYPDRPGEVAVVMKGAKGAGKGTVARWFGKLFGQHFLHVSSSDSLTGRFNIGLRDAVLVFADEAFWGGDKKAEGSLKRLITENVLEVEGKFVNRITCPNYVHLLMASNADWVVPATTDERRYFIVEVDDSIAKNEDWFGRVNAQMASGGAQALLHDLLDMDLDLEDWSVRTVPNTQALAEQKLKGLTPFERWWFEKLKKGELPVSMGGDWDKKPDPLPASEIRKAYEAEMAHRRDFDELTGEKIGRALRGLTGVGTYIRPENFRVQSRVGEERVWCYTVPDLISAREAFERHIGGQIFDE